jgi:long-subunit fatty acid transport protein
MQRRISVAAALGVAVSLTTSAARADNFNLFGYGPRAAAMGGAMTAEASDYTSVFYNPALMVERKDVNFGLSFQWYRMTADVRPKDQARELDCSACTAPDSAGFSLGLVFPLGGKVKNRLALGLGLYLPSQVMLRVNAPDPRTPYWYRYHANPERIVIHTGLGIKLVDWLKLGVGIQALADLLGNGANVRVDLFSKEVQARELNSFLGTRVAPVVGLHLSPLKWLRFGVTYKGEMKLVYEIPAKVELATVGTLAFAVTGVAHFTPHTINAGVAVDLTDELTLSAEGEWQQWSAAPSPYANLNVDLSGAVLEGLGLGSALDLTSPVQRPGFSDTLSGRLGLEYRIGSRFQARLGGFFRPTPVPRQSVAGTNLLDGTAIGVSGGFGFNFDDPLEIMQHPIQIDVAAQGHFLLSREVMKESTDVVPSYTAAARIGGVTASVRYDF